MKNACKAFPAAISRQDHGSLAALHGGQPFLNVQTIASNFVELQEQRHRADNDLERPFSKLETLELIRLAEEGFVAFQQAEIVERETLNIFLAALFFYKTWNRSS